MGREVRRVPKDWQHPKDKNGNYIPLLGGSYSNDVKKWDEGAAKWAEGFCDDWEGGWRPLEEDEKCLTFEEWEGSRPKEEHYMPDWSKDERTHLMMYEDTSEGTPISPAFETPEELAQWLADNNASAFADMIATYEQWLAMCKIGWAPSVVCDSAGIHSGVESMSS